MNVKELNNELILFCKKYNRNEKLIDFIVGYCKNRVAVGKILDIFNKNISTELDYIECYWIIKAIKEYYKTQNTQVKEIDKIKLTDSLHFYKAESVFTETEIQNAEAFYTKKQKTNTVIIQNVNQVSENLFSSFKVSFQTIAEMFNAGIINYNFESQREAKVVDVGLGELLRRPTLYKDHVEDIKYNMKQGTFFANHVVFNILDNGEQLFEYNEKRKTLKFTKTAMSQMNILDGYHRCSAITELVNQNPQIEGFIQLNIFMLNIEEAQSYINQEAKASPISDTKKESLKKTVENEIVKNINSFGSEETNKMYNKITSNIDEIKKFHTKFANAVDLSKTIEEVFDKELIKKFKHKRQVTNDLVNLFNYWIDLHEKDFDLMYNNKNYKLKNFRTTSNMFSALIYVYSKYFNANVRDKIYDDLEEINDSLNNITEEENKIFSRILSKSNKSSMYKVLNKYVDFEKYLPETGEINAKI